MGQVVYVGRCPTGSSMKTGVGRCFCAATVGPFVDETAGGWAPDSAEKNQSTGVGGRKPGTREPALIVAADATDRGALDGDEAGRKK